MISENKPAGPATAAPEQTYSIPLKVLKESIKNLFLSCVDTKKCWTRMLVLDTPLVGPLKLCIDVASLEKHFIKRLFILDSDITESLQKREDLKGVEEIVFFTEANTEAMKKVAKIILNNEALQIKKFYQLWMSPRRNVACSEVLKITTVVGKLTDIKDVDFDLIPLDSDVLSLEKENMLRDIFLENDTTPLNYVAWNLLRLEYLFGSIPVVFAKGDKAKSVLEILNQQREVNRDEASTKKSKFDAMIILDRSVDWVTACSFQKTYEGLVDEVFDIKNSTVKIDAKIVKPDSKPEETKMMLLNSDDVIFKQIRDLVNQSCKKFLEGRVATVKKMLDDKNSATMDEIRQTLEMVKSEYGKLTSHLGLVNSIIEKLGNSYEFMSQLSIEKDILISEKPGDTLFQIEMQISKLASLKRVLNLLCLRSLVDNGIKAESLKALKKEFLQGFGYHHLLTFANLEKVGLLKPYSSKGNFQKLKEQLNLIVDDFDEDNPTDPAYFYGGYVLTTVRLIEAVFKKDHWKGIKKQLDLIPGTTIFNEKENYDFNNNTKRHCILVYFVGGVTYSEVSACRFIAKAYNKEIYIATTSMLGKYSVIDAFSEKFDIPEVVE